jgi:O-antigen ligase
MSITDRFPIHTIQIIGIIILAAGLALGIGVVIANQSGQPYLGLEIIFAGILALAILRNPYWGIIATIASLPVLTVLPSIPVATSAVALIGGLTLGALVVERVILKKPFRKLSSIHFWALLLIAWMLVTNPSAALLDEDRNWLFTFAQLWLLLWLAGEVMNAPQRQRMLMWVFAGLCITSALFAITAGTIGPTWQTSERAAGLVGGDNSAARYFLVGFVFLTYLSARTKQWWFRLLALGGAAIILVGVAFTLSRTGFILAITTIGLILIQRTAGRQRIGAVILLVFLAAGAFALPDTYWQIMFSSLSNIQTGEGTMGLRYGLWQAGLKMWLDHPLTGVGIGQFDNYLPQYGAGLLRARYLGLGAHNLYVSMLAETGLVGLALFCILVGAALIRFIRSARSANSETSALAQVWLIVFVIILVGGLTKHDQYDKLLWLVMGIGVALQNLEAARTERPLPLGADMRQLAAPE